MTARILQRLCSDWQKRLRLMDWRITLKYEPCQDKAEFGDGTCSWCDRKPNVDSHDVYESMQAKARAEARGGAA